MDVWPWLSPVLAPPAWLYALAVRRRVRAYEKGRWTRGRLPGRVVSVGNLTTGGTGKTPAVMMLARWAQKQGFRPAVLSRGYGGRYRGEVCAVSDGTRILADWRTAGDEPVLLAQHLPGVPVVLARKRHMAGKAAGTRFGADFFILDDGFQHLALQRDVDIVLLDARRPFGNGHVLPRGPLREPWPHLARAHVFVLTRYDGSAQAAASEAFLQRQFPETPVFHAVHAPAGLVWPLAGRRTDQGSLAGRRVAAFAGIARPETFRAALAGLGARIVGFRSFRDHYAFRTADVRRLARWANGLKADCVVTTEKDWVRLPREGLEAARWGYLAVRFAISGDEEERFFALIRHGP